MEHDPTDFEGEEIAQAEKAVRSKSARDVEDADFKWLMGSRRGRRIVWRRLDRAGIFRSSFNSNSMAMAFAEGCKNDGLRIIGQIHLLCPDTYSVMIQEALDDKRNNC